MPCGVCVVPLRSSRYSVILRATSKALPHEIYSRPGKKKVFYSNKNANKYARKLSRVFNIPFKGKMMI